MTPFELDILLHYYGHADDHPVVENNPPVWRETLDAFKSERLLQDEPCVAPPGYPQRTYRLTERGQAYVAFVLAVPLPITTWRLPEPNMLGGIQFPDRPDACFAASNASQEPK